MARRKRKLLVASVRDDGSVEFVEPADLLRRRQERHEAHAKPWQRPAGLRGMVQQLALDKRARVIFEHEGDASREELEAALIEMLRDRAASATEATEKLRRKAKERAARYQRRADEIWRQRSSLSVHTVAGIIAREMAGELKPPSPRTIRKHLKKP